MKYSILYFLAFISFITEGSAQADPSAINANVHGAISDKITGKPLAARIVVIDDSGKVYNSFYKKLDGFFTHEDGTFSISLSPGKYRIKVYRGIDYVSIDSSFDVASQQSTKLNIALAPWVPLKKLGWVNGDGHDHLYTDVKHDSLMLDTVRRVFIAQGIDFLCAAQGWAGYDDSTWRKGYSRVSDEKLMVHYGSEMPKYRTGHTWWLGQTSTKGIYWQTMDTMYENHYYQSAQGTQWSFDTLRFPQIPDIEIVKRFRQRDNAVAVIAHPTSWWWQKRGDIEKYVTNVAAYIPFGLLAGKVWEGQVIMGYDRDHYYYQNLWFNVLNAGYKMTPVSELDGGYNRGDKFFYGSMRTYYKVDGPLTIDKVKSAVRDGKTFVTSGPIVFADVDKKYTYGDVVPTNVHEHTMNINAYSSGEHDDYISFIVLFRNGKIFKRWDTRQDQPRNVKKKVLLKEKDNSWYVIKVYGKRAWRDTTSLDVMKYCDKQPGMVADSIATESDVAITSPFYFRSGPKTEPEPLMSNINLTVEFPDTKGAAKNIICEVLLNGNVIQSIPLEDGKGEFKMPVDAVIKVSVPGLKPIYRTLYLDYIPFRNIIENLASGKWLSSGSSKKYNPGEVPWSAFEFEETKRVLTNVRWNIIFEPNERDKLWEPFNDVFRKN